MVTYLLGLTSDQNTLAIGLLIPILGVLSPLLLAALISRNNRKDKQQDWDRQDEVALRAEQVAKQAAEAARLVVERQDVLDRKTDEVARLVATSTTETTVQLKKIHGLVNSHYTEAIRAELGATKDTLALMSELIENRKAVGLEPTLQVIAAFKGRESKIKELEDTLKIREEADEESKKEDPQQVIVVNPEPVPVVESSEKKETRG